MTTLLMLLTFMVSFISFSNAENTLPERHDIFQIHDNKVENIYKVIFEPPFHEKYKISLAFSVNSFSPFTKMQHTSKVNDQIIYDVIYESADLGLRKIPDNFVTKNPKRHLIIAGDSNVFGDGVESDNTLPVLLAKKIIDSRPYNFGIRGGGPNNTLALMEFFPWKKIIKEEKGIFIYNYYDLLFERVIGAKSYISWTNGITPYYDLNEDGVATYQGNFNKRFLTKIFHLMNSTQWLRELFPVLPKARQYHFELVGKVFLKMYHNYKQQFPDGSFFVALNYNFHPPEPGRLEKIEAELIKNKVPYFIVPFVTNASEYLFRDFHLSPNGHRLESDLIFNAFLGSSRHVVERLHKKHN